MYKPFRVLFGTFCSVLRPFAGCGFSSDWTMAHRTDDGPNDTLLLLPATGCNANVDKQSKCCYHRAKKPHVFWLWQNQAPPSTSRGNGEVSFRGCLLQATIFVRFGVRDARPHIPDSAFIRKFKWSCEQHMNMCVMHRCRGWLKGVLQERKRERGRERERDKERTRKRAKTGI